MRRFTPSGNPTLGRRAHMLVVLLVGVLCVLAAAGTAPSAASAAGDCAFPGLSHTFQGFGDNNPYFLAPGGNFESGSNGWTLSEDADIVSGNESYHVGDALDSDSLALPGTSSSVTTPALCVTSAAPTFRMFIKNNGNLGHTDGQLAVYLNFSGADGKMQRVKIAGLTAKSGDWTLSPKISFVQYISTPLKSGYANISFTIKPNDNHGNWQIDDLYVDPFVSR
jgi:hypothetical protein